MLVRVLLADDNSRFRAILRRLLERDPHIAVVGEAEDGQDAVDLVGRVDPDVVVMDVSMPRVDGLEATTRVKRRHPEVAVLLLSVAGDHQDAAAGLAGGASAYLIKGAPPDQIAAAIKHFGRSVPARP
jgi:DNA-binding NarL/FixJ family response regulator